MNITSILTFKFVAIVASVLFIFSVFIYQFYDIFRQSQFGDRLHNNTRHITNVMLNSGQLNAEDIRTYFENKLNVFSQQTLTVLEKGGAEIFRSSNIPAPTEKRLVDMLWQDTSISYSESDTEYVAFHFKQGGETLFVIGSAVDTVGNKRIERLRVILLTLFIISLIITALLGWLFARQALMPIKEVVTQVDKITAFSLYERVNEGNGRDEIAKLAITFNNMLERLENTFSLQKTFVANASHEFRTPLTIMKGKIEVLLLQPRKTEEYIQTMRSLIDDINNQIELVKALNELAKANADFPDTPLSKVTMIELLDEAISELYHSKKYRINLQFENIEDVEDADMLLMNANVALMKSALINVMDNACKFSPDQYCEVKVRIRDKYIVVDVQDYGIGISDEDLRHVFEPFYRSNNTRNVYGHGIGLSLVKKIIEFHKGFVSITSVVGEGTRVEITIPNTNA